jgi:ankyrin repeat protein
VGHIDTVALLLRLGFVPTVDAINTAAKRCDLAKVELLLLHGCPLTGDPLHNDSPLLLAIESGHIDNAGATTFARFASQGVFHRAVRAPNPLEMLEFVLRLDGDLGVSVNDRTTRTERSPTCYRWADLSFAEVTAVCERLVAAGATVTEVDYRGATALHYGAESANTALMKLLLERGSDINARARDRHASESHVVDLRQSAGRCGAVPAATWPRNQQSRRLRDAARGSHWRRQPWKTKMRRKQR